MSLNWMEIHAPLGRSILSIEKPRWFFCREFGLSVIYTCVQFIFWKIFPPSFWYKFNYS